MLTLGDARRLFPWLRHGGARRAKQLESRDECERLPGRAGRGMSVGTGFTAWPQSSGGKL